MQTTQPDISANRGRLNVEDPSALSVQVFDRLMADLQRYSVGQKLPSERDLAETYGVSRMTVRDGIRRLADRGMVHRWVGRGTFVVRKRPLQTDNALKLSDIGLWAIGVTEREFFENTLRQEIFIGVEQECRRSECNLHFTLGIPTAGTIPLPRMVTHRQVGGIIVVGGAEWVSAEGWRQMRATPHVIAGNFAANHETHSILADNAGGVRMAMEYLWSLGHRDIAYMLPRANHMGILERLQSYKNFMMEHGGFREERVWRTDGNRPEVLDALLGAADAPTALMLSYDHLAYNVLQSARRVEREIPKRLSLVGFDNDGSARTGPGLTTVSWDHQEAGRLAVRTLRDAMENPARPPSKTVLPVELIVRNSCAPCP